MALRVAEITLAKGSYTVTIYAPQVEDGITNKIYIITTAKAPNDQSGGAPDTLVTDLLRLTRTFRIMGHLTSNTAKSDLIKMIEGAGVDGGTITLTYPDGGDATSFSVFVESCIITQKATDEPDSAPTDFAKFDVTISLVKGITSYSA